MAYVSNEIFIFLKGRANVLYTFLISIWFNNYEQDFGGKIQKWFMTPSLVT